LVAFRELFCYTAQEEGSTVPNGRSGGWGAGWVSESQFYQPGGLSSGELPLVSSYNSYALFTMNEMNLKWRCTYPSECFISETTRRISRKFGSGKVYWKLYNEFNFVWCGSNM